MDHRSQVDNWNGYYPLWSGLALDYLGYIRNDPSLIVFDNLVGTPGVKITDQSPPLGTKWNGFSGPASQMIFATGGTSLELAPASLSYSAANYPHSIGANPKRIGMTFFVNPGVAAKWSHAGVCVRANKTNYSVISAQCIRGLTTFDSCHLQINEWNGVSLFHLGSLLLTGYDADGNNTGTHTLIVEDNGVNKVRCYLADYPAQVLSVTTTDLAVDTKCGIYFDSTELDLLGSTRVVDQAKTRVLAYYCMQIPTF